VAVKSILKLLQLVFVEVITNRVSTAAGFFRPLESSGKYMW